MTHRSFVCTQHKRLRTSGETKPDAKDMHTNTPVEALSAYIVEVVGGRTLTAIAPALPSPLRKTAPYGPPVHRLGDCAGRFPGSRVVAQLRPAFPVSQWPYDAGSPLTVTGVATDVRHSEESVFPLSSPVLPGEPAQVKFSMEHADESSAALDRACSSRNFRKKRRT